MKKNAMVTLVAFASASVAIAMHSKIFPKAVFAESPQASEQSNDEKTIRELNAAAEAAWNKHDAATMDQHFVADCDFVNVFGEWISGRDNLVKTHTFLFAGPLRESYRRFNLEKIRFLRPGVAVVHVRGLNTDRNGKLLEGDEGAMGVLVMVKERGKWWIVAGQNTLVRPLPEGFKPAAKPLAP